MGKGGENFLAPPRVSDAAKLPPRSASSSSTGSSASSSSTASSEPENAVYLNIYDVLTPDDPATIPRLNNVLVHCGLGVFHTGVQVWGREFAFGGHPDDDSGVFEVPPKKCPAVRYRSTLLLGYTKVSEPDVEELADFLGTTEYVGNRYSLISRNCNTFSQHFTRLLGVQDKFPAWVNRLACMAVNVSCLLPEGVDEPLSDVVPSAAAIKEPQKPPPIAYLE